MKMKKRLVFTYINNYDKNKQIILNLEGYSQNRYKSTYLRVNIELFKMQYNGKLELLTDYELPKYIYTKIISPF